MVISEIINNVMAGGLLGSLGQGIRIAVGLRKFNENNAVAAALGQPSEEFNTGRLIISIFIGFVAGAIGMLTKGATLGEKGDYNTEAIITIIAIGYSGADFIEGIFKTYVDKFKHTASPSGKPVVETVAKPLTDSHPGLVPDEANFSTTPAQG